MKKILLFFSIIIIIAMLGVAALPAQAQEEDGETKTIYMKALESHECNDNELHVVINQVRDENSAPETIHIKWANGLEEDVGLWKFDGTVAHYITTSNLDSAVVEGTAEIYIEWEGQFNLSHGPCHCHTPTPTSTPEDPTPTPTSTPEDPTSTPTSTPEDPTPTSTPKNPTPTPTEPSLGGACPSSGNTPAALTVVVIFLVFLTLGITWWKLKILA